MASDLNLLIFSGGITEPRVVEISQAIANQMKIYGKLIHEDIHIKFMPDQDGSPILLYPSRIVSFAFLLVAALLFLPVPRNAS